MFGFKNSVLVKYEGLNFNRFLDFCLKHNIELSDIEVKGPKVIFFKVSAHTYKHTLLKAPNKWYNISVVDRFGVNKLKHIFFKRIGLFVGLICIVVFSMLFSKTTFNYNITGLETINKEEIVSAIESFGIKRGKINEFNNEELEQYLIENIQQISLVSVMTKGNTLCVNIKEKTQSEKVEFSYITAPYTMLINEISLTSGTALVKVGDVVLKGTKLVAPYIVNGDGSKNQCKVSAVIKADVWFCGNVDFKVKDNVLVRTGKKVVHSEVLFANKTMLKSTPSINYENYEVEKRETKIVNLFYPLTFKRTVYYECEYKEVTQSLEDNKQKLLTESEKNAYNTLPSGFSVSKKTQNIIKVNENLYKVQTYLRSTLEINSEN